MPWFHVQLLHATRCNNCRLSSMLASPLSHRMRCRAATRLVVPCSTVKHGQHAGNRAIIAACCMQQLHIKPRHKPDPPRHGTVRYSTSPHDTVLGVKTATTRCAVRCRAGVKELLASAEEQNHQPSCFAQPSRVIRLIRRVLQERIDHPGT